MRLSVLRAFFIVSFMGVSAACGPIQSQKVRYEWKPAEAGSARQEKGDVAIEYLPNASLPSELRVEIQACNQYGLPAVDPTTRAPVMERFNLASSDQVWVQVAVTNNMKRSLRLFSAVPRMIDPAGMDYEPMSLSKVKSAALGRRRCYNTADAVRNLDNIRVLDEESTVPPGLTTRMWLVYSIRNQTQTGMWRVNFYDVPTKLDASEKPGNPENFEIKMQQT
ncbi:MAG: hypothetical protein AB1405_18460, partial [Bdellovibrionota bacterium]